MKDIPGFEGRYAVTEDGRVWSYPKKGGGLKGRWLTQFDHRRGYKTIYLSTNSKHKMMFVHSVVARTYLPNPKCEKEINHIDGNKHNNNVGNLEWSNRSDNMKHAYKLGLLHNLGSGENHSQAKLTWQKVAQIKGRYIRGVTKQRDLANEYGVSQRVIWGIVNGKLWVNASCK